MNIVDILKDPLSCLKLDEIEDILDQEAYIAASELDSPNSPDFDRLREKMTSNYLAAFNSKLATQIFKNSVGIVSEHGPKIRVSVTYATELLIDDMWTTDYTNANVDLCVERAHALRKAALEQELEGMRNDSGRKT